MTKHKHLTLSDRNDIQLGLERGETFKAIGQSILKDPTTVSKEVKRNRQVRESTCDNLPCPLLDKAPFVCNGCPKRRQNCGFKKIFYLAKQAQKQYEQTLVEAREGTPNETASDLAIKAAERLFAKGEVSRDEIDKRGVAQAESERVVDGLVVGVVIAVAHEHAFAVVDISDFDSFRYSYFVEQTF